MWLGVNSRLVSAVRFRYFAFYLGNGTLAPDVLGPLGDCRPALVEFVSVSEMVFAILGNVLDVSSDGTVANEEDAARRAAQYARQYLGNEYVVEPPFEDGEVELPLSSRREPGCGRGA
ncbi:hypothetical protein HF526_16685 [Pseudonocardia sp. K10HN5]|uniref:DUF7677 domain-containing protein n=2 Tax=Pseudonocardia acidicola TaxID=2724939 RepID=A0ABX1SBJ7_9PSEU|nr:hypothetical protein [Pseudonocardia acidicola]